MKIALATDAWAPQVNGVVRTLSETVDRMRRRGYQVGAITPDLFLTIPMPGYPEIRLAVAPRMRTRRMLNAIDPDIVHIATEGPIGWSARSWCLSHNVPFTTAFHTQFPQYASLRTGISADRFWPLIRRFHAPSKAVLASTPTLRQELFDRGIVQSRLWSRGVDTDLFRPDRDRLPAFAHLPGPILLSVGRVAVEKNLEAFLSAPAVGTKVIVGDGPMLDQLRARYPDAVFLGALHGKDLASAYASADIFVFPSLTDTFGLVMIEALASGLPVAGFPVPGPLDVIGRFGLGASDEWSRPVGALNPDLSLAIARAERCSSADCVAAAKRFSWEGCVDQFVDVLIDACGHREPVAA